MHTLQELPENYVKIEELNLQSNKKLALKINGLSTLLMVIMFIGMNLIYPFADFIGKNIEEPRKLMVQFLVLLPAYIVYIILHELTHGVTMKHYGAKKVRYGFTGLYAFAGSLEDYFDKYAFARIGLAPLTVFGLLFLLLQFLIPSWFWTIWFLQIANVSGAAGDLYVYFHLRKLPDSIKIRDSGVDMIIYDKQA